MTPEELLEFCKLHGGQKAVAERIGRHPRHINKLVKGKQPISDKIVHLIELAYK